MAFIACAIMGNLACTDTVTMSINYNHMIVAYYALAFPTNALCTLLVVAKIAWHRYLVRASGVRGQVHYEFLISVITESGALYALAGVVNLVLLARDSSHAAVSSAVFNNFAVSTMHVNSRKGQ
jgi:hypothetical protein